MRLLFILSVSSGRKDFYAINPGVLYSPTPVISVFLSRQEETKAKGITKMAWNNGLEKRFEGQLKSA